MDTLAHNFDTARARFIEAGVPRASRRAAEKRLLPTVALAPENALLHLAVDGLFAFELALRGRKLIRGFAAPDGRVVVARDAASLITLLRACAVLEAAPNVTAAGLADRLAWLQPEDGSLVTGAPDPFSNDASEGVAPVLQRVSHLVERVTDHEAGAGLTERAQHHALME